MTDQGIHVVGAWVHAKIVIATLQAQGQSIAALHDDDSKKWGQTFFGFPVVGPATAIPRGARAIIAVGANLARRDLAVRLQAQGVEFGTAVHPSAVVHPSVRIREGAVIFAGAVIQPDARIGAHAIVNTRASIDHDCVIGDFAHVAPGVALAGNVTLEEGAFLGVGASAIPGAHVGAWATVGAGGVVIRPIAPGVTAVGVPARPLPPKK